MTYCGSRVLGRHIGPPATLAWGALLCFPAPTFLELSMTAWGNHVEAGVAAVVFVSVAVWTLERPSRVRSFFLGLVLSWALWIGFSAVFLVLALGVLGWRRLAWSHLMAAGIGLTPVAILWGYQHAFAISSPFETIYYSGEATPQLGRVPEKVWSLLAPRQLVGLFGDTNTRIHSWIVAATLGCSAWIVRRHSLGRLTLGLIGAFLVIYCSVRFTVWTPPAPEIAPPGSMRYAAPLYGLLWLVLAAATGLVWERGRWWLAIALVTPSLLVGINARTAHYTGAFPDWSVLEMTAPDFLYARDQAAYSMPSPSNRTLDSSAGDVANFYAFSAAWHETKRVLDGDPRSTLSSPRDRRRPALEGLSAALLPEVDRNESSALDTLGAMNARLSGFSDPDRVRVLSEAARRRDWTSTYRRGHQAQGLVDFATAMRDVDPVIAKALTEDLGRRWAADLIRWRTPAALTSPPVEGLMYGEWFARGYAETAGRRLGNLSLAVPSSFREHAPAWRAGLIYGHQQQ